MLFSFLLAQPRPPKPFFFPKKITTISFRATHYIEKIVLIDDGRGWGGFFEEKIYLNFENSFHFNLLSYVEPGITDIYKNDYLNHLIYSYDHVN